MSNRFELLLFTADPAIAAAAADADIDAIVVDLECRDKHARQADADTEINCFHPSDVAACRVATARHVICRINAVGTWTETEIAEVLDAGADELLVPMVRTPAEVETVLAHVDGRVPVGALIETPEAVARAAAIAALGLSRLYIGLNDLAIARGTPSIFTAMVDGTVDRVAEQITPTGTSLGLAGLTLPDRGSPIPCRLLIAEMARLGCGHAFMRRSFLRDVPRDHFAEGVLAIREALAAAALLSPGALAESRRFLAERVDAWSTPLEQANV